MIINGILEQYNKELITGPEAAKLIHNSTSHYWVMMTNYKQYKVQYSEIYRILDELHEEELDNEH